MKRNKSFEKVRSKDSQVRENLKFFGTILRAAFESWKFYFPQESSFRDFFLFTMFSERVV